MDPMPPKNRSPAKGAMSLSCPSSGAGEGASVAAGDAVGSGVKLAST